MELLWKGFFKKYEIYKSFSEIGKKNYHINTDGLGHNCIERREKMNSIPAICGGISIRKEDLRYGRQYIDDKYIQAVVDVLKGQYIKCGPMVNELRKCVIC